MIKIHYKWPFSKAKLLEGTSSAVESKWLLGLACRERDPFVRACSSWAALMACALAPAQPMAVTAVTAPSRHLPGESGELMAGTVSAGCFGSKWPWYAMVPDPEASVLENLCAWKRPNTGEMLHQEGLGWLEWLFCLVWLQVFLSSVLSMCGLHCSGWEILWCVVSTNRGAAWRCSPAGPPRKASAGRSIRYSELLLWTKQMFTYAFQKVRF